MCQREGTVRLTQHQEQGGRTNKAKGDEDERVAAQVGEALGFGERRAVEDRGEEDPESREAGNEAPEAEGFYIQPLHEKEMDRLDEADEGQEQHEPAQATLSPRRQSTKQEKAKHRDIEGESQERTRDRAEERPGRGAHQLAPPFGPTNDGTTRHVHDQKISGGEQAEGEPRGHPDARGTEGGHMGKRKMRKLNAQALTDGFPTAGAGTPETAFGLTSFRFKPAELGFPIFPKRKIEVGVRVALGDEGGVDVGPIFQDEMA